MRATIGVWKFMLLDILCYICRWYSQQHLETTCSELLRPRVENSNGTVLGSRPICSAIFHWNCQTLACYVCSVPNKTTSSSTSKPTVQVMVWAIFLHFCLDILQAVSTGIMNISVSYVVGRIVSLRVWNNIVERLMIDREYNIIPEKHEKILIYCNL